MAIREKDLTAQVNGITASFSIIPASYAPGSTILVYNGEVMDRGIDYNENVDGSTLVMTFVPPLGDKLWVYYDDLAISAIPSYMSTTLLKSDYLFGLELKDQFGHSMPDTTLANKISIAIARMERELKDFNLSPKVIKSTAVKGLLNAQGGVVFPAEPALVALTDIFEDPYDYDVGDYLNWGYIALRRKPIVSVERIRLIYPTGQEIITYPIEWIKIFHKFSQIQIVPMAGSFKQYPLIGQGAMYLPLMSGFLTKSVPQLIHVDYTAGLTVVPDDLKDAIYKLSAVEILKTAGQGRFPGVASMSTSADGLSENTTLTQSPSTQLYGALIKQYEDDVKLFIKDYRSFQKGIDFRVM